MISVCLATYNGEKFIKEQIESILPQLSSEDEIVVSDDGSKDKTLDILRKFNDPRIKINNHQKRDITGIKKGAAFYSVTENFANAISLAKGDFIFLSDQDDIWYPEKVSKCLKLLSEYDCITTNYTIMDEEGNVTQEKAFKKKPIHKTVFLNILDSHFRGCCMAFRKEMVQYILPVPPKVIGHDYWIGIICQKYGKIGYELEPLIKSRWYSSSVSAKRKNSLFYKLNFRFNLYLCFIKRILEKK